MQAGFPFKPPVSAAPAVSDSLRRAGTPACRGNAGGEPPGVFAQAASVALPISTAMPGPMVEETETFLM